MSKERITKLDEGKLEELLKLQIELTQSQIEEANSDSPPKKIAFWERSRDPLLAFDLWYDGLWSMDMD